MRNTPRGLGVGVEQAVQPASKRIHDKIRIVISLSREPEGYGRISLSERVFDPDASRAALARAGRDELAFSLFTAPAASGFPEAAALVVDQALNVPAVRAIGIVGGHSYGKRVPDGTSSTETL